MKNFLNIGVVSQQFDRVLSGPGLHARNLVRRLVADGHHVVLIAPSSQSPVDHADFEWIKVPTPQTTSHVRWLPLSRQFARAMANYDDRQPPVDLWHFTDAREALFCTSRRPMVGNINDTYAAEGLSLSYYRQHYSDSLTRWAYYIFLRNIDRWAWNRFAILLANSHYTARVIGDRYPSLRERITVYHKSVEPADFDSVWARRESLPPHPPRVLYVGGNMQRKGVPTLIRAIRAVAANIPNVQFWIVGQDPVIPRLQALSHQLGIEKQLSFLGLKSQAELIDLYAQADVFVMPSLTEAFGVVFLEAMAAGLPAVGTSVGGIPEIIQNGWNGRLVPPDCPQELSSAIIEILTSDELRTRFRENGRTTAQRFSLSQMMTATYAAYDQVLSSKNGSQ
jgi:glycosyltransferase involved in cell wall biosynthesis